MYTFRLLSFGIFYFFFDIIHPSDVLRVMDGTIFSHDTAYIAVFRRYYNCSEKKKENHFIVGHRIIIKY